MYEIGKRESPFQDTGKKSELTTVLNIQGRRLGAPARSRLVHGVAQIVLHRLVTETEDHDDFRMRGTPQAAYLPGLA